MRYAPLLLGLLVLAALLLPWPDDDDAVLSPTGAPLVSAGQIEPPTPGDVDCSGELTVIDALLALRFIVAFPPFPDCIDRADKDCDGSVDVFDAVSILRQVAGLAALGAAPHCPIDPFIGTWEGIDIFDGSNLTLSIASGGDGTYDVMLFDDRATGACPTTEGPASLIATGTLSSPTVLHVEGLVECPSEGTSSPHMDDFTYDSATDTLTSGFGNTYNRAGP